MLKTFDPRAVERYSLPEDLTEPKTFFHLGRIDAPLHAHLIDQSRPIQYGEKAGLPIAKSITVMERTKEVEFVRFGVRGWENLGLVEHETVPFDPEKHIQETVTPVGMRKGLTDEALTLVGPYISRLADRLEKLNEVSGDVEKNSD